MKRYQKAIVLGSIMCLALCLSCKRKEEDDFMIKEPNELLSVIADENLRYRRLVKVVQGLGPANEPSNFWSDIANSSEYSKHHRRVAVVELIKRHVKPGFDLSKLSKILDNPAWLEESNVRIVTFLAGYIPLKELSPGTVFEIRLFPELEGLLWAIYFRVSGEVTLDDFLKVLNSQDAGQQVKDSEILEIGIGAPDYDEAIWNASIKDQESNLLFRKYQDRFGAPSL